MFDATALGRFQRRRLLPMLLFASAVGVSAGALGAKFFSGVRDEAQSASQQERRDPWTDGELRDVKSQLIAERAENEALTTDLRRARREKEHLRRELARVMESKSALESELQSVTGASSQPRRALGASINRPTPPVAPTSEPVTIESPAALPTQEAGLPVADSPFQFPIRRIFRAKSSGIRLEDLSRHYGVSMDDLKRANPDLHLEVRPAGHFLLQGASVNIPAIEE